MDSMRVHWRPGILTAHSGNKNKEKYFENKDCLQDRSDETGGNPDLTRSRTCLLTCLEEGGGGFGFLSFLWTGGGCRDSTGGRGGGGGGGGAGARGATGESGGGGGTKSAAGGGKGTGG